MTVPEVINDPTAQWDRKPPASPEAISCLIAEASFELPRDYLIFLQHSNGGYGVMGVDPWWFSLWSAEEVMQLNRDYRIKEFAPRFFGFGSDGGGYLLAFDMQSSPWKVIMIPFIPMEEKEAEVIAEDFLAFVRTVGREAENLEQLKKDVIR